MNFVGKLTCMSRTAITLAVGQPLLRMHKVPFLQATMIRNSTSYKPESKKIKLMISKCHEEMN